MDIEAKGNKEILDNHMGGKEIAYTPTVMLYGKDKMKPIEYTGDYKLDTLKTFITDYCVENGYGGSYNIIEPETTGPSLRGRSYG